MTSHWTYPARIGITARELKKRMKAIPPLTEGEKRMLEQRMIADAEAMSMQGRFRALGEEIRNCGRVFNREWPWVLGSVKWCCDKLEGWMGGRNNQGRG